MSHEEYMQIALDLSLYGMGSVAPNPMVGCVIVHNDEIISKGYHTAYGEPHAEVEAIRYVVDKSILKECTLYVTLEPCAHFGKTPPCANLITDMGIPRVVIGTRDPFSEVNGRGIEHLKANGVEVIEGILEDDCRFLNRRFFTFHEKKRPYIILKWAQTADGFMDKIREENERGSFPISSSESRKLVHQWRSLEQAILVGPTTALNDNPALTVRLVDGENPIRIVIDEKGCLPEELQLFNNEARTIALVGSGVQARYNCEILPLEKSGVEEWMRVLHTANIQSILVEGGAGILNTFIESGMWDEMRVFTSNKNIGSGLKAPLQKGKPYSEKYIGVDHLTVTVNK